MRSALVFTILLLAGCGAVVRPIARVDRFGPWDQPRGMLCANGRPLSVDLRQPPACGPGEEAWEQRFPNGSLLRECRTAERVTARQAISLSTTGCIEEVERWRTVGGRVVHDTVRSWARQTEHLELVPSCPQSAPCLVGNYQASIAGGPQLIGSFDDAGLMHGVWRYEDGARRVEAEFVHGLGQVRDWPMIAKLDCVDGLVEREFLVRRSLADGGVVELSAVMEQGRRHGAFHVGVGETTIMAGRYERGAPVGPWTLPISWCVDRHLGSQCGFPTCIGRTHGTTQGTCAGSCVISQPSSQTAEPTPILPPQGSQVVATPTRRLTALMCHEVLRELVPAPTHASIPIEPTWAELSAVP